MSKIQEFTWDALIDHVDLDAFEVRNARTPVVYAERLRQLLRSLSPKGNDIKAPTNPLEAIRQQKTNCLSAAAIVLAAADTPPDGTEVGLYSIQGPDRPYPHFEIFCIDNHQGSMVLSGHEGIVSRPVYDKPSTRILAREYRRRKHGHTVVCASWDADRPMEHQEVSSRGLGVGVERLRRAGFNVATFMPYGRSLMYIERLIAAETIED